MRAHHPLNEPMIALPRFARPRGWIAIVAAALAGCGGDSTQPQRTGSIGVTVTTTGSGAGEVDGYTVLLGSRQESVAASGSATFDGLEAGSYEVALGGVAANCTVDGGSTRSVTVTEGQSAALSFDVECVFDAAGATLPETTCPAVSPDAAEGMPFDVISLGAVPSDIERPILARASWAGGEQISLGLTYDEDEGVRMTIPLHPSGSLEGGDVTVRLSDETQTCPPFAFRILPLPVADGELDALVDVAQALLDELTLLFGTTRDELLDTPMSELEPVLVPLAVAQVIVDNPSGTTTLRAHVDGTAPEFGSAELDFAERLLARTGLRADLEAELAAVRSGAPARSPVRSVSWGSSPGLALECVLSTDMDAELLDQCMTLARDKAQGSASAATQDNAQFAMDQAVLFGGLAGRFIARPIGTVIKFSKIYDEALADNLPSSFASIDVDPSPRDFMEDESGPGDWSPALVTAVSNGWSLEAIVSEIIQGQVTPEIRFTRRLTRLERYLVKRAVSGVEYATIRTVESFFQSLFNQFMAALVGRGVSLGDEFLTTPPIPYGPVDVTDTEWTDSRIVDGSSFVLTTHEQYEPREAGVALLEVITAVGKFGGTSIATPFIPLTVSEISVSMEPTEIVMEPGADTVFNVTVLNARHADSVELISDHPAQGSAELLLGTFGEHTIRYTAPSDPAPGSTDLVAVHHVGQGGARGYSSEPRSASATIRFAGIDLLPVQGCVAPEQEVQLEWTLTGFETAPGLVWTPSAGEVDGNGLFTAPGQEGTVTITVAVADAPNLTDSIEVSVGDCVCAFTLQVGGNPTYVGQPGDRVSYFSSSGLVPDEPYAIGSVSFSNAAGFGASVAVEIPTTVVTGPGDYPLRSIGGGLGYGGDGDFYQHASPPSGTLRIVQYEPHTALVGEVIGGVVEDWESDGPEFTFSATFQVYPPAGALGWNYACIIPESGGG